MLVLIAICIFLVAVAECFYVFKNYKKLLALETLINNVMQQSADIMGAYILRNKKNSPHGEISKSRGANRTVRTLEQRAKASAKRKEWWENKRAQEATQSQALINKQN